MIHTLDTITGTGIAVPLSATPIATRRVIVSAGLANSGTIRITGDALASVTKGQQLNAGDSWEMPPSPEAYGTQYNLSAIFVYIPVGDTVIASYGD